MLLFFAGQMTLTRSAISGGTCPMREATRSAWGSMTMMASWSRSAAYSLSLWVTTCCTRVDLPMRVRAT